MSTDAGTSKTLVEILVKELEFPSVLIHFNRAPRDHWLGVGELT